MDFAALAHDCAPWVAPQTLAAIVRTESQFRPLAIGVNGGARLTRQPSNKEEAIITAKWLIASGYNVDLGLGQVNSSNLKRTGLSVEDAFDPCRNLAAAATILHANYELARNKIEGEQAALQAALSAYNTGSFSKGFANGYVRKVLDNAVPAPAAKAGDRIPLEGILKPAVKVARPEQPLKLRIKAVGEDTPGSARESVYGNVDQSVMVYR